MTKQIVKEYSGPVNKNEVDARAGVTPISHATLEIDRDAHEEFEALDEIIVGM